MPIYEYQCNLCGHQLDAFQKMSEEPLKDCPECGKPALTKLVSASGFQLKGSGWYVTDYSSKGKAKSSQQTDTSSGNSTSDAKSTDSKNTGGSSSSDSGSASS